MNLKLVVLVCFCLILAAFAKPTENKGGKDGKGGKGGKAKSHPEKPLVDLCSGLEDGSIANTDPKFDGVFSDLNPVCGDLLAFEKTQPDDEDDGDNGGIANRKKKNNKKGKNKKGWKNGKNGNKGGNDNSIDDHQLIHTAETLLGFCKLLRQAIDEGIVADLPIDLSHILGMVMPICDTAEQIADGTA